MKVLVLGKNGQLARHLQQTLPKDVIYLSRNKLDISHINKIYPVIKQYHPDLIVNATAYTNTKNAESDSGMVYAINACAVSEMARVTNDLGIPFIHISTDYVFDGKETRGYQEGAKTNPINIYGASKCLGEELALRENKKTIIIRTSWLFSEYGHNFLKTIFKASYEKTSLDIISDQQGCPTYAGHLAQVINQVIEQQKTHQAGYGIYHYADKEPCSWYDFAKLIIDDLNYLAPKPKVKTINAVSSRDWSSIVNRPQNGVLLCQKIKEDYNIDQHYWAEGVRQVISKLKDER